VVAGKLNEVGGILFLGHVLPRQMVMEDGNEKIMMEDGDGQWE